jgi:clan AA aspartic protease (TIGR02281 family)
MYKNYLLLLFNLCISIFAVSQLNYADLENLNLLSKKKDFNAAINFLKYKGYTIQSFNENIDNNNFIIISEIKASIDNKNNNIFDLSYDVDNVLIKFLEYDQESKLEIRVRKYYNKPYFPSNFLSIKHDALKSWGDLGWTQILIQSPSLWKKNNKTTFDSIPIILENIDKDSSYKFKNLAKAFVKSYPNTTLEYGLSSNYPNYNLQKINLKEYFIDFYDEINLNKVIARNRNPDFGDIVNYELEYTFETKKEKVVNYNERLNNTNDSLLFYNSNLDITLNTIFLKNNQKGEPNIIEIPLIQKGNTYYVKIKIAGKEYVYVIDSGASATSINQESVNYFISKNLLKLQNRLSDSKYQLADGTIITMKRVQIPLIELSDLKLYNIEATIVENNKPLLLGKSFFDKFKSWKIDNKNGRLILEKF